MSFRSLKSQEDCLNRSKSLPSIQESRWKRTWSFNLHGKLPLSSVSDDDSSSRGKLEKGIRKYYGKKIQYVSRIQDQNVLVSHSKLVRYAEIQENWIYKNRLKTKGNLVIFGINVEIQGEQKVFCFKKSLNHCQKADLRTRNGQNIGLLMEMLALRSLYIDISATYFISSLNRVFRSLVGVEQITAKYMVGKDSRGNNPKFFSQFHQLARLKRLRLICNYQVLQTKKQDLEKFYEKPFDFDLSIKIYLGGVSLEKKGDSILEAILSPAEYLCIEYWEDLSQLSDDLSVDFSKEAKKKIGKRNIVELSLEDWKSYSKTLLSISSQIKKRSHSLQHLSLYLRAFALTDLYQISRLPFNENSNLALEEISACGKLNIFKLLINVEDANPIILGKILSNKSLEVFQLALYSQKEKISLSRKWDQCFMIAIESQVKELSVKIPKRMGVPLFGTNLLGYIQSLKSLQVVELVDENLEAIAFDFLSGLVTCLLDKKGMRRILICTKVVKKFYSEHFGKFFSKLCTIRQKDKLNEISQEWERRVKMLKDLQLEEILVGKLSGYSFSYLVFNRKMGITDKLFWTQTEMEDLLPSQNELKNLYSRVFY